MSISEKWTSNGKWIIIEKRTMTEICISTEKMNLNKEISENWTSTKKWTITEERTKTGKWTINEILTSA